MKKWKVGIVATIVAWLGIDSALDQRGLAIGVFDLRNQRMVAITHHRAVFQLAADKVRGVFRRKEVAREQEPEQPHEGNFRPLVSPSVPLPEDHSIESFESYMDHISHLASSPSPMEGDPRLDSMQAGNRELVRQMGVDLSDPAVYRGAMFACFSISTLSYHMQEHGMHWPPPYVISNATGASFAQVRDSMAEADDFEKRFREENGGEDRT